MADALDMITGAYMKQQADQSAQNPSVMGGYNPVLSAPSVSGGEAYLGPSNANLGIAIPDVPDLFNRPQGPADVQAPAGVAPPAPPPTPPPAPPAPAAFDPTQALMLQNLLANANQAGPLQLGNFGLGNAVNTLFQGLGATAQPSPMHGSPLFFPGWNPSAASQAFQNLGTGLQGIPEVESLFQSLGLQGMDPSVMLTGTNFGFGPAIEAIAQYLIENSGGGSSA